MTSYLHAENPQNDLVELEVSILKGMELVSISF